MSPFPRKPLERIQCQNCMEIVDLPQPVQILQWVDAGWVAPRVPPHGCRACSGDWDCPRDLEPNWREAGWRAPCTEEHGECEGPLVVGFMFDVGAER